MRFTDQIEAKLAEIAREKRLSREDLIASILDEWLRANPAYKDRDGGLAPDELNASNDG